MLCSNCKTVIFLYKLIPRSWGKGVICFMGSVKTTHGIVNLENRVLLSHTASKYILKKAISKCFFQIKSHYEDCILTIESISQKFAIKKRLKRKCYALLCSNN